MQICSFVFVFFAVFHGKHATIQDKIDIGYYREKVKQMFYHAYNGYMEYAYPYDELRPLTCDGHDTWGSYSLTLIDALDTLAVMGNNTEFRRVSYLLIEKAESFFDMDINVSVFETNIRVVGGLLSAHLMMKRAGMLLEPGWPCSGPLLRMAENIARKLLPAFDTPTGMPYGTVNLRHGVPKGETTVTCTAGVGTFIVEFGTLSRLTGDPIFEKVAMKAIRALWNHRSPLNLLGNHVDVGTGKWTALDSGIGGGVDSYFEYLVKGAIMFDNSELLEMFRVYEQSIVQHLKRDDWYMWANMKKGGITLPLFTSLDAYWPGIQSMLGDLDSAMKTIHNFHQVWQQFGATPEFYNIPKAEVHQGRESYPLRPELIESTVYLYRATRDPFLLKMGVDMVESIEHVARTKCGYATVKDVRDHRLENRMESFFLAETTKYLYLLFDQDNFLHNSGGHGTLVHTPNGDCVLDAGGYIFNTEAHPIDLAAVHCCSAQKKEEEKVLQEFHDSLNILELLDIVNTMDVKKIGKKLKKRKRKLNDVPQYVMPPEPFREEMQQNVTHVLVEDMTASHHINASLSEEEPLVTRDVSSDAEQRLEGILSEPVSDKVKSEHDTAHGNSQTLTYEGLPTESTLKTEEQPAVAETSQPSAGLTHGIKVNSQEVITKTGRKKQTFELAQQLLDLLSTVTNKGSEAEIKRPNVADLYVTMTNYSLVYMHKPNLMRCPAQPFHARLSVWGEFFETNTPV